MLLISSPILILFSQPESSLSLFDIPAIILFLIGLIWESTADLQMHVFQKKPEAKGKIMTQGLWKYSRHPNYFGETTLWWGIFFLALPVSLYAIFSPIFITVLLLKVSGIPLLESKMQENPDYRKYMETTNSFFPWFPRQRRT